MSKVGSVIDKTGHIVNQAARFLSQATVAIMVLTVLAQVFMRYFLKNPLIWADELSRYSLVFMTFLGASVALRDKQLAAMELVTDKLKDVPKRVAAILSKLVAIALMGFLFYFSISLLMQNSVREQLTPAMQIPMTVIYFSLPLGIGATLFQSVLQLFNEIKLLKRRKEGGLTR